MIFVSSHYLQHSVLHHIMQISIGSCEMQGSAKDLSHCHKESVWIVLLQ